MKNALSAKVAALTLAAAATVCSPAAFAQKAGGTSAPSDAVITIDQTKAMNGNITQGDLAGFPIHINTSGTYRLIGNLAAPQGSDAIVIGPGVHANIEMSGFQIGGPATCSHTAYCFVSNGTFGIRIGAGAVVSVNGGGRVRGFTAMGIGEVQNYPASLRMENVVVSNNGYGALASRLMAARVIVEFNSEWGMKGSAGSIIESIAQYNGASGIGLNAGVVRGNVAQFNKHGFWLTNTVVATENVTTQNTVGPMGSGYTPVAGLNAFN